MKDKKTRLHTHVQMLLDVPSIEALLGSLVTPTFVIGIS